MKLEQKRKLTNYKNKPNRHRLLIVTNSSMCDTKQKSNRKIQEIKQNLPSSLHIAHPQTPLLENLFHNRFIHKRISIFINVYFFDFIGRVHIIQAASCLCRIQLKSIKVFLQQTLNPPLQA